MQKQFSAPTVYFLQEGRENLRECLTVSFQAALQQNITKIVIFTARGEGVRLALEHFCTIPEYRHIRIIAVTFPAGIHFTDKDKKTIDVQIADVDLAFFQANNVPVVRAHLPFDPIAPFYKGRGDLGQDLGAVAQVLNMFCGSMSLCVQAIAMACDAGYVGLGEHVISVTSDTAILAQGTCTHRMIGEMVIREILCKPVVMSIVRREVADKLPKQLQLVTPIQDKPAELPSPGDIPPKAERS
jgi:hypothetical protein